MSDPLISAGSDLLAAAVALGVLAFQAISIFWRVRRLRKVGG